MVLCVSRRRRQRDTAQHKPDPLLQFPAALENGELTVPRLGPTHKISRQVSKNTDISAGDYVYRQQTRPLIPTPDVDTYIKPGSESQGDGAPVHPPPYYNDWNTNDISRCRSHDREYESPVMSHDLGRMTGEHPPVYFELDPAQASDSSEPAGHQRSPVPPQEGLNNHVSV